MAFKLIVLSAFLAAANAGYLGAPAAVGYAASPYAYAGAVGSQTQSVVRSADGNSAVSTYSKAVDTAYSSVRKYDTRVSNDAILAPTVTKFAAPALAYSAPAYAHAAPAVSYAAPIAHHAAPLSYAAPAYAHAAPALSYAAPIAHHAAPLGYAAAPVAARAGLLGVAYSPATAVAHISYNTPTLSYAY